MSNATVFFLASALVVLTGSGFTSQQFAGTAYAQWHSQNNAEARARKNKAQKALLQAMELNARVEMMIKQGIDERDKMEGWLDQSYGFLAVAINEMEGVNRMAKFKDPMVERGIKDMYNDGKPETMKARGSIAVGAFDDALEHLAKAKLVHQRFLIVTY